MRNLTKFNQLQQIELVESNGQYVLAENQQQEGRRRTIGNPIVIRNIQRHLGGGHRGTHYQTVHLRNPDGEYAAVGLNTQEILRNLDNVPHELWEDENPAAVNEPTKKKGLLKKAGATLVRSLSRLSVSSESSTDRSPQKKLPRHTEQQQLPRVQQTTPQQSEKQRKTARQLFKTPEPMDSTPRQQQQTTPQNQNMEGFSMPDEGRYHQQTTRGHAFDSPEPDEICGRHIRISTPSNSEASSAPATPQRQREWKSPTSLCNVSPIPSSPGSQTTLADEVQQLRWDFFVEIANTNEGAADLSLDYVRELYKNRWIDQNILWKRIDLENDRENAKRGEKNRKFNEACAATQEKHRQEREASDKRWDDAKKRKEEERQAAQQVEDEEFRQHCIRMTIEENEKNREKEKKAKERAEFGRIAREKLAEMEAEEDAEIRRKYRSKTAQRQQDSQEKQPGTSRQHQIPMEEQPGTSRQHQMPMEEQPSSSRQHQHIPMAEEIARQQPMPTLQQRYETLLQQLRPGIRWGEPVSEELMEECISQIPRVPSEAIFELNVMNMPRVHDWPPHFEEFPKVPTKPPGYKSMANRQTAPQPEMDPIYKK
jgi:hypothetical protein